MTDEEFDNWCRIGRSQREDTWPAEFMPVLVLITPDGIEVHGFGIPPELWPSAFEAFRKASHPTDAVLTSDSHFRVFRDGETPQVRPREDAAAVNALIVLGADGRARAMPYAVHDDGRFSWLEEEPGTAPFGPVSEALAAMVRP